LSLSKGLDRDRAVDETGGQIAVFGRRGARSLNADETRRLYLDASGKPWFTTGQPPRPAATAPAPAPVKPIASTLK